MTNDISRVLRETALCKFARGWGLVNVLVVLLILEFTKFYLVYFLRFSIIACFFSCWNKPKCFYNIIKI